MSRARFLCGVDAGECGGALTNSSAGLGKGVKTHASSRDAHRCKGRSLINRGYTRVGLREFQEPNEGPVLVLDKQSKFGKCLRPGKGGEVGGSSRVMPNRRHGGLIL